MYFWFDPEHEGKKEIADLYNNNHKDVSFDDWIVFDYIYFWHNYEQIVLGCLATIKDEVVKKEWKLNHLS